jgi:hypothetical protein
MKTNPADLRLWSRRQAPLVAHVRMGMILDSILIIGAEEQF